MYVEKDYILRLIHEIVRTLIKLLFGKDIEEEKDIDFSFENEELYKKLIHLIDNGEINSAENSLMEHLNLNDKEYFKLSLLFYEHLSSKDDSFLTKHDFTREEILAGLKYIANIYGYSNLIQVLTKEFN